MTFERDRGSLPLKNGRLIKDVWVKWEDPIFVILDFGLWGINTQTNGYLYYLGPYPDTIIRVLKVGRFAIWWPARR